MKQEKLQDALNEISDQYIEEAVRKPKRRFWRWAAPLAAVLAVAILIGAFFAPWHSANDAPPPSSVYSQHLVAAPVYPRMAPMPNWADYDKDETQWEAYDLAWDTWRDSQKAQYDQPEGYADGTETFFAQTMQTLLSGTDGENRVCSPVNIYMALAMLAQATDGESRQEVLDALGSADLEALRKQAGHIWNAHYCADNATFLTLANSLWLDADLTYNEKTARILADSYYASVFRGELGSEPMNEALRGWINDQTGGLLREQADGLSMSEQTVLELVSTIYYRCKWRDGFWDRNNKEGLFHSPSGDRTVTYMNTCLSYGPYYWGDKFGAIFYELEDGGQMWLILPDEGNTPESLLTDPQVQALLQTQDYSNRKTVQVNLSLPKFDIRSDLNLAESLQTMGIRSVFSSHADFSAILPEQPDGTCLSDAKHAARVAIDEEGIVAAAYTVLEAAGAAPPPEEEIDFVLDRPFLFVVQSRDDLPLFCGVVNEP